MPVVLTDQNFEKEISQAEKPVLVDFWMENCFPCVLLSPILEKLENDFSENLIFAKVNFSLAPSAVQKYGLRAAPTIVFFREGKPIDGFVGLKQEAEIRQWLNNLIKSNE